MYPTAKYLIFSIIFLPFTLPGQIHPSPDFIVTIQQDTLYGKVEYLNRSHFDTQFLRKIHLRNEKGRKVKIPLDDVSAFRKDNWDYEGYYLSQYSATVKIIDPIYRIDRTGGDKYFLKVISKGAINHYHMEWIDEDNSILESKDLLKKESDMYFIQATQGIFGLKRKALVDYFEDCKMLQNKLQNKEINELEQLIEFYNSHCSN